jgi:sialidase-1
MARLPNLPVLLISILMFASSIFAEGFSSTNLWNAGIEGYATYRIPGIVVTKNGAVLAYAAARRTLGSDWSDADIVIRRSVDGGRTFSASQRITRMQGTTDNPTAIADPVNGAVYMLFQRDYAKCYFMRSDDEGRTFSAPTDITAAFEGFRPEFNWNVLAPGPGHAIVSHTGRIIVPVWLAAGTPSADGRRPHRPSAVATIYSDDHGRTWRNGAFVLISHDDLLNPSETTIAELSDGRILLNLRSESTHHRRLIAYSSDGAAHWTTPIPDEALFDPICAAGLVRYPASIELPATLLFSNPDSASLFAGDHRGPYPRQQLAVRVSFDDGKTWPITKLIDAGSSAYSDLGVTKDGTILCLYESGSINGKEGNIDHITLARFSLQWLSRGEN